MILSGLLLGSLLFIVQAEHFFDILARIAQAGNLVLATQLAFLVEPVVEEAGACHDDFQRLQGQVVLAFGLVVGVDLLQRVVQDAGELAEVVGHPGKFDQPLMAALGMLIHEDGSGGVVRYLGARLGAGLGQSLLGIVYDELLAEGVDEVLGAPRDDELVGTVVGELHRVADDVSPEAGRSGDDHGVVLVQFHVFKAADARVILADILQRDEFVEDAVVDHQQHGAVGRVALRAEVAFGGIVGFHVVHLAAVDHLLVLFAVGCEGYTAVEEDFQIGPHFLQALLAGLLQDVLDEHQHPRRYARQVGDVGMDGFAGNGFHLRFEVLHQSRLLARHADEVDQRVEVFHQDGRQVAYQAVVRVQVGSVASAQNQSLAREEAAFGVLPQVEGYGVLTAAVVRVVQRFLADGQELALVVRRTRRLGKPAYLRRPQQVLLSGPQAGYVGLYLFISLYRQAVLEVFIGMYGTEVILPTPLRLGGFADETHQYTMLYLSSVSGILIYFLYAGIEIDIIEESRYIHLSY